jgi:outer membrane protein OmpA-like peptidoglycan-associated protein
LAAATANLKSYLDAHAGAKLAVSGYNDPSGNAALNAALSKKRA